MKILTSQHKSPFAMKPNGFTLIELMITVAIVGILASIAYPSYLSQVRKSRRSDAVQSLAAIQQAQERYRSNNPTYTDLATLAINSASSGGYYTLAAAPASGASAATRYTASAVAVSSKSQAGDTGCSTMSITVTNGSATNDQPNCWSK